MLKNRAGFTLVELMVALVLTSVIGVALTTLLVSHTKLYDTQEKQAFARGVSHGGMNMIMTELRMLEMTGGLISATNKKISVKAPYALGIVCGNTGQVTISRLPVDSLMLASVGHKGYAYRNSPTTFKYVEATATRGGGTTVCRNASVAIVDSLMTGNLRGNTEQFSGAIPSPAPAIGQQVFMYQHVTYEFKESVTTPGTTALWRTVESASTPTPEELVAPFDTTAKFRFYVNDGTAAQTSVPADLTTISGLELTLDGLSQRPDRNGNRTGVALKTSVFFKNRP
jgi:prepilin-type N-terminal cleavage/methylation domain-containing protein